MSISEKFEPEMVHWGSSNAKKGSKWPHGFWHNWRIMSLVKVAFP